MKIFGGRRENEIFISGSGRRPGNPGNPGRPEGLRDVMEQGTLEEDEGGGAEAEGALEFGGRNICFREWGDLGNPGNPPS